MLRAKRQVQLKRKCKDDLPRKREDYDAALISAKVNSIRSWTAQKSAAFAELYQNSEQEIIEQIDTYLLNQVIASICDRRLKDLHHFSEVCG